MKKYNSLDMKGRLYDYALEADENQKGNVVKGEISVEVDADGTVVKLRFYVNEITNAGKVNRTYGVLESMLAGNYQTVVADGDDASWMAFTGSIDVSYFKGRENNDLIRSQKLRGGFVNENKKKEYCNKWKLDLIITDVTEVEEDLEKQLDRFVKVGGYLVDDYRERVMEVEVQARSDKSMDYILGNITPTQDNPYFVSTWGQIQRLSRLVTRKNAFGEDDTEEYQTLKFTISGMNPECYDIGEENVLGLDTYQEMCDALKEHKEEILDKSDDDSGSGPVPKLAF